MLSLHFIPLYYSYSYAWNELDNSPVWWKSLFSVIWVFRDSLLQHSTIYNKKIPSCTSYLFGVGMEGDWHVQEKFPLLHPPDKVLNPNFQMPGCFIDLFRVTFPSLSQLLCSLQELVCIGVCILPANKARNTVWEIQLWQINPWKRLFIFKAWKQVITRILKQQYLLVALPSVKGECIKPRRLMPEYIWNNFSFETHHPTPILPGTAIGLSTCLFPSSLQFLKDNAMKQVGLTSSDYSASPDTQPPACCNGLPTALTLQLVIMLARHVSAPRNICLLLTFVR